MTRTTTTIAIFVGGQRFEALLQDDRAPAACAWFMAKLPWLVSIIHARWSGEACWVPLGSIENAPPLESATSYPRPGELLLYPGGISEAELLIAYGPACFSSRTGQLAGSPVLIVGDGLERLAEIGRDVLWSGHKRIQFELSAQGQLRHS